VTLDARIIALDQKTGKEIWSTRFGDPKGFDLQVARKSMGWRSATNAELRASHGPAIFGNPVLAFRQDGGVAIDSLVEQMEIRSGLRFPKNGTC